MDTPETEARTEKPARRFWWYLEGRAGRAEYWAMVALLVALSFALSFIPGLDSTSSALTVPLMFAQIRRVHDFGRSGWWAVAATVAPVVVMIPVMMAASLDVGVLVGIVAELALIVAVGAIRGDAGENRFGPPVPFGWKRTLTGR